MIVDPEHAPLVRLGFELFVVGNLTSTNCKSGSTNAGCAAAPPTGAAGIDQQAVAEAA
ncbi:hypothetical protein [Amycolatopsis pithecellobii]|uniref:Uncharacterized protein n=1 Tax=Amycolatopsis pithecellobii TaxID=664692 RepID=A0A6N7Z1P9_9PSEU|nr:hypothetical protein [Amycolatopsis pithecellobii]MTD52426.1 hypothetical protein [Amycolatopsis pithecellobii]